MAAVAYSTPVSIPSHERGGPVTRVIAAIRKAERAPYEGRGCVILNGELVVFEAGTYPAVGAPALVIFGDGHMAIVAMPSMDDDSRQGMSPGFLIVRVDQPYGRGVRVVREQVALIGAVASS